MPPACVGAFLLLVAAPQPSPLDHAIAEWKAGRAGKAEAELKAILREQPSRAAAWKWLGVVYASESRHELAEQPFREACRLDPRDPDGCYFHGRNLYALDRFEAAIEALEAALGGDPQPWRIHLAVAQSLEALGRAAEAEKRFEQSLAASPAPARAEDDPRLHFGVFLQRQGRTGESIAPLRAARPSAKSLTELGRAMVHLDRIGEAVVVFEKAVALDARYWTAHLLLGKAYLRLGRPEEADRHLKLGEKGLTAETR